MIKSNFSENKALVKYITANFVQTLNNVYRKLKNVNQVLVAYSGIEVFGFKLKVKLFFISRKKIVQKELPKDTVIIYQFPRNYLVPSLSPFSLKLETWCRASGIKYQV